MNKTTHPYVALAFLTGLNLFNYMDRYVLASVVPPVKAALLLNDTQIGWLTSAFMIGYFATSPAFGYLGDRWPRKGLIAFGVTFWSLGTILTGLSEGFWTMLASRVLVGLGEAAFAVLAPAWIADLFPSERRNNALTLFYIAMPVGSALGYMLGGAALLHGGWRVGFWWAGAPGLLLALALLLLNEPRRGESSGAVSDGPAPGAMWNLFRIAEYNLLLIGWVAYTFALGAFAAWGPTFLNRVHKFELDYADHFFGTMLVVGGLLGTLIGGFAATALHKKTPAGYALMLALSVLCAAVPGTLAFLDVGPTWSMVYLGAAVFLSFLPTGPVTTLSVEIVPAPMRAASLAASIFVIHLFGDFWSPVLIGRLADAWAAPGNPGAGLQHAMLVLPAVMCVAVIAWGALAVMQAAKPAGAGEGRLVAAIQAAWRWFLGFDNLIFGLVLVPVAIGSWVNLYRGALEYQPLVAVGFYAKPALGFLTSGLSAIYVTSTCLLLLTAGRPVAREEGLLPNLLAVAGAFGVYGFGFLTPADEPWAGSYLPLFVLCAGAALVLVSLCYLRRSFAVTPQARAVRQGGPYALIRHPMYAGNILTALGLGMLTGTGEAVMLALGLAGLQVGRAVYEERLLLATFPAYADYRAGTGAFLPRLRSPAR